MKKQQYQTSEISFDDFMAHPEAFKPSAKSVDEMAREIQMAEADAKKKHWALKKAQRIKKGKVK